MNAEEYVSSMQPMLRASASLEDSTSSKKKTGIFGGGQGFGKKGNYLLQQRQKAGGLRSYRAPNVSEYVESNGQENDIPKQE